MATPQDAALAHVATLAAAGDSVSLGPTGVAAVVSDQCRAYQALAADSAASARVEGELLELVRSGSPGAIVYAALLLRRLGRDVAPLLEPYRDDRRACSLFPGGCMATASWLCEAVRWVLTGELWAHPERLLAYELEALERAQWFELPTEKLLRAAREHRRAGGRLAPAWVITFAQLFVDPLKLHRAGPKLTTLLLHPAPQTRLYAALLLRALDPARGEAALTELATSRLIVDQIQTRWWPLSPKTISTPIAEVVRSLAGWPGPGAGGG